jgi:hypothetical protein
MTPRGGCINDDQKDRPDAIQINDDGRQTVWEIEGDDGSRTGRQRIVELLQRRRQTPSISGSRGRASIGCSGRCLRRHNDTPQVARVFALARVVASLLSQDPEGVPRQVRQWADDDMPAPVNVADWLEKLVAFHQQNPPPIIL